MLRGYIPIVLLFFLSDNLLSGQDISAIPDLVLHLDANSGIELDNSKHINKWTDETGNYTFTPRTDGQPQLDTIRELNENNAVLFSENGTALACNQEITIGSMYIVAKFNSTANEFPSVHTGLISSVSSTKLLAVGKKNSTSFFDNSSFNPFYDNYTVNELPASNEYGNIDDWKIISATASPFEIRDLILGQDRNISESFWNGYLAEVIIFSSVLNEEDNNIVRSYLNEKYINNNLLTDSIISNNLCEQTITPLQDYSDYTWYYDSEVISDDSTISTINSGQYILKARNLFGTTIYDTTHLYKPSITYPIKSSFCTNDSLIWKSGLDSHFDHTWIINTTDTISTDSFIVISNELEGSIQLFIADTNGCTEQSEKILFKEDSFSKSEISIRPDTICAGETLRVDTALNLSYLWQDTLEQNYFSLYTSDTVTLLLTNANGCTKKINSYHIVSGSAPIPSFSYSQQCFSNNIDFVNTSAVSEELDSISWYVSDTVVNNLNFTSTLESGKHAVKLFISTESGCSAYLEDSIQVQPVRKPQLISNATCSGYQFDVYDQQNYNFDTIVSQIWMYENQIVSGDTITIETPKRNVENINYELVLGNNCAMDTSLSIILKDSLVCSGPSFEDNIVVHLDAQEQISLSDDNVLEWQSLINDITFEKKLTNSPKYDFSTEINYPIITFSSASTPLQYDSPNTIGSIFIVAKYHSTELNFPNTHTGLLTSARSNKLLVVGQKNTTEFFNDGNFNPYYNQYIVNRGAIGNTYGDLNDWKIISASSDPFLINDLVIGQDRNSNSSFWNGPIAEIIIYDKKLSDYETNKVQDYLFKKYVPELRFQDTLVLDNFCGTNLSVTDQFRSVKWYDLTKNTLIDSTNHLFVEESRLLNIVAEDYFGIVHYDTIYVKVPQFNSHHDSIYCYNAALAWDIAGPSNFSTEWYNTNGDLLSDSSILVLNQLQADTTIYGLIQDNNGCFKSTDTIAIKVDSFSQHDFWPTDTLLCENNTLDFNEDNVQLFSWNDTLINVPYVVEATETVTFSAQNLSGCYNSDTINIVNIGAAPILNWNTTNTVCTNQESVWNISITSDSPISNQLWKLNKDTISQANENVELLIEFSSDSNRLTTWVTNDIGCTQYLDTTFSVFNSPTADFDVDLGCSNEISDFYDRSVVMDDVVASWNWKFADNNTITSQNIARNLGEGNNNVSLTVTTDKGCSNTIQKSIKVIKAPEANFEIDIKCIGTNSQITSTSLIGDTALSNFLWTIDNSSTLSGENINYTFVQSRDHLIRQTITDYNNCTDTATQTVYVRPIPELGITTTGLCIENKAELSVQLLSDNDSIMASTWYINNLGILYGDSVSLVPNFDLNGIVEVETNSGCILKRNLNLEVVEGPSASFDVDRTFGAPPLEIQITTDVYQNISQDWFVDDSLIMNGDLDSLLFEDERTYVLSHLVYNNTGCFDSSSKIIEVTQPQFEVLIDEFDFTSDGRLSASILNNSNVTINHLDLFVELGGKLVLQESLQKTLAPGASGVWTSDFILSDTDNENNLNYFCLYATTLNDIYKTDKKCLINEEKGRLVRINQNPFRNKLEIVVYSPDNQLIQYKVYDETGYLLLTQSETVSIGNSTISLDLQNNSSGYYIISLVGEDFTTTQKIIKLD